MSNNINKENIYEYILTKIEQTLNVDLEINYLPSRPVDVPINYLSVKRYEDEFGTLAKTCLKDGIVKTYTFLKTKKEWFLLKSYYL